MIDLVDGIDWPSKNVKVFTYLPKNIGLKMWKTDQNAYLKMANKRQVEMGCTKEIIPMALANVQTCSFGVSQMLLTSTVRHPTCESEVIKQSILCVW